MTTNCIFNKDGQLINIGAWDEQRGPDDSGNIVTRNPLPDDAYSEQREVLQGADGGFVLQLDPIMEAERFIAARFSPLQLLQMKTWKDDLETEDTPKLSSTYNWTSDIVRSAAAGQTQFAEPPHTFTEIVEECAPLL
jgi:hypothetical protein